MPLNKNVYGSNSSNILFQNHLNRFVCDAIYELNKTELLIIVHMCLSKLKFYYEKLKRDRKTKTLASKEKGQKGNDRELLNGNFEFNIISIRNTSLTA